MFYYIYKIILYIIIIIIIQYIINIIPQMPPINYNKDILTLIKTFNLSAI